MDMPWAFSGSKTNRLRDASPESDRVKAFSPERRAGHRRREGAASPRARTTPIAAHKDEERDHHRARLRISALRRAAAHRRRRGSAPSARQNAALRFRGPARRWKMDVAVTQVDLGAFEDALLLGLPPEGIRHDLVDNIGHLSLSQWAPVAGHAPTVSRKAGRLSTHLRPICQPCLPEETPTAFPHLCQSGAGVTVLAEENLFRHRRAGLCSWEGAWACRHSPSSSQTIIRCFAAR